MSQAEWVEHEEEMEIPKGTGIPGLLKAVEGIAKLPRVRQIIINSNGKIDYSFYLRKGEEAKAASINFETVMPLAIARNGLIEEINEPDEHAAVACAELFEKVNVDQMYPIAFLGGADSRFWNWYASSTGTSPRRRDQFFGIPFLFDRMMEDMALLLCAGYKRNGLITDTVKSYKIAIPQRMLTPVEVMP